MKCLVSLLTISLLALPAPAQWLPDDRQAHERKLWDSTGVEFPKGMRFYDLPKVSQRLVGIERVGIDRGNVDRFGIFDEHYRGDDPRRPVENVNAQYPWTTPAGLHASPKDQWRKAAAAYFPGAIKVYRKNVQVQNGIRRPGGGFFDQPQPHIAWAFPERTVFAEMLIRTYPDGREHPFEIRSYEVHGGKMVGATTYRPWFFTDERVPQWNVAVPPGKLADFGFGNKEVRVHLEHRPLLPDQVKFVPSRHTLTAATDDGFVPRHYLGNVRTCTDCHNQAGKPTSYGATTIRGSAPNLSWHPFTMQTLNTDADPVLDYRWPLAGEIGRRP